MREGVVILGGRTLENTLQGLGRIIDDVRHADIVEKIPFDDIAEEEREGSRELRLELRRFDLELLDKKLDFGPSLAFRGLDSLHLRLHRREPQPDSAAAE